MEISRVRIVVQIAKEVADNPATPDWLDVYTTADYPLEKGTGYELGRKIEKLVEDNAPITE